MTYRSINSAILFWLLGLTSIYSQSIFDADGNNYKTVTIGTQTWMAENLKTTKYNDSISISLVNDEKTWINSTSPGYCWYNNAAVSNKVLYGALYNWYSVKTGKLCPLGWHVPSDDEWAILIDFVGGAAMAGGKLKEAGITHWRKPNQGATNETRFTALPAGVRGIGGKFNLIGTDSFWWCSTENFAYLAWTWSVNSNTSRVGLIDISKKHGLSVRCLKD